MFGNVNVTVTETLPTWLAETGSIGRLHAGRLDRFGQDQIDAPHDTTEGDLGMVAQGVAPTKR